MIRIFAMIKPLAHLTEEQFHRHWRHPHGTLTCKIPQIRAYAQFHGIGSTPLLQGLPFTGHLGVPVIEIEQLSDLDSMYAGPEFDAVREDSPKLYDPMDLIWLPTRSIKVTMPAELEFAVAPVNAMMFLKRSTTCPALEFAMRVERFTHAVCHSISDPCGVRVNLAHSAYYSGQVQPPYDAVVEMLFINCVDFDRSWKCSDTQSLLAEAMHTFLEPSGSSGILTRERKFL